MVSGLLTARSKENPCGKQGFLYNIFSLKSQGNFGIFYQFI
jgi:hypothetical protein